MRALGRLLGRIPFTAGFVALLWTIGIGTGSVPAGPPPALGDVVGLGAPALAQGYWWTPVTSMLWCGNLTAYALTTIAVLALCAPAERVLGTGRTILIFVLTHVLAALPGTGLVAAGAAAGEWWSKDLGRELVVGPSIGALGVGLAFTARCSPVWQRRLRLVLVIGAAMLTLYSGHLQDVLRMLGGVAGLLLGPWLAGRTRQPRLVPPSRPEARLLLALVAAASAVGPLIAAVSGTATGPLSVLQQVFLPPATSAGEVASICADSDQSGTCRVLDSALQAHGLSPAFLSLIPVLVLLVLAEGLRRGRRFALWGAVTVNIALASFGAVSLRTVPGLLDGVKTPEDLERLLGILASTVQPLAVAALLVACRRAFHVPAPRRTYLRLGVMAAAAGGLLSVGYVGVGYLARDQFAGAPGPDRLLLNLPSRFIPPGYLDPAHPVLVPLGPAATLLDRWTGVLLWTLVLVGVWLTFWRSRMEPDGADAALARRMLREYGGSELSYMTTWHGNHYWFSADRRVVVAYRLVASVALTVGDPIGDSAAIPAAVLEFTRFCGANGWTPCLYSITGELADALGESGWKLVQVAEETRLPLAQLSFTGRRWQDIRTAVNRARRDGMTAQWHTYSTSPEWVTHQIRAVSAEWVLDRGMPEMGFTLGGLAELSDDEVRCLVAVDADGRVQGVTSWLPVYRNGRIEGWTLDLMRRRRDAANGVMEFLIATAATDFREEGAAFVSLSGAPLARLDRGEPPSRLQQVLDQVGRALEPIYGFRSLLAFKAKFQPEYRPLFMAYPESAALPVIGGAVTRAYLPGLTLPQGLRLVSRALRHRRTAVAAA
jgi:phosphatidylglycerol lysyltransferase